MAEADGITAERVVEVARSWVGTPYRHQASVKGAGADCLGVLRGVYAELYGSQPESPPPYRPDWYEARRDDLLLRKARQYLTELDSVAEARPGDALVFRMRPGMAAKHVAILVDDDRMVHALTGRHVEEVTVNHRYRERCVAAFRFPGV